MKFRRTTLSNASSPRSKKDRVGLVVAALDSPGAVDREYRRCRTGSGLPPWR